MAAAAAAGPPQNNATRRQAAIQRKTDEIRERQTRDTQALQQARTDNTQEQQRQELQRIRQRIDELQTELRKNTSSEERQQIQQQINRLIDEQNQLAAQSQHLFRVITGDIKQLILDLKNAAANGNDLNQVVNQTVKRLELMGDNVAEFAEIQVINEEMRARPKQVRTVITSNEILNFIDGDKETSAEGVLSQDGKTINLETLDTDRQTPDPNRLATEEQDNFATEAQIKSRLINCQYLEILYLTKHDELMKIFQFTLNLYDKYTYAIKILLFVLKNLLEQRPCPPREPPQPGEPQPPHPPIQPGQIKLPKALISNIKQLLKDQKQVKDVIERMRPIVERDTLPELVEKTMADRVSAGIVGSTIDTDRPGARD